MRLKPAAFLARLSVVVLLGCTEPRNPWEGSYRLAGEVSFSSLDDMRAISGSLVLEKSGRFAETIHTARTIHRHLQPDTTIMEIVSITGLYAQAPFSPYVSFVVQDSTSGVTTREAVPRHVYRYINNDRDCDLWVIFLGSPEAACLHRN